MRLPCRRLCQVALLLLVAGAVSFVSLAPPDASGAPGMGQGQSSSGRIRPGYVLVKYREDADSARRSTLAAANSATEVDEIAGIRVRRLRVPEGREREIAARLAGDSAVEFAEPDGIVQALDWPADLPNDRLFPEQNGVPGQWNLREIRAPEAWQLSTGSPAVKVAVVDTGLDMTHPDRPANVESGTDYVASGAVATDPYGHGTHVTGIIAARTDNCEGVAGLAPNVTIIAIRVLDDTGSGYLSDVASGIIEAANRGARVINLSLGGNSADSTLRNAVQYAQGQGALVVAAAGNSGQSGNPVVYPAAYQNVLAVAATTRFKTAASYSESGAYVGISAPGGDNDYSAAQPKYGWILSTTSDASRYAWLRGTSMAAPHVSGLAALVMSARPDMTASDVADLLKSTANHLGQNVPNGSIGYGEIDAAAALERALPDAPIPRPPSLMGQHGCYAFYLPLISR